MTLPINLGLLEKRPPRFRGSKPSDAESGGGPGLNGIRGQGPVKTFFLLSPLVGEDIRIILN